MTAPFGRLYLPGPTEVLPEVLAAQNRPMMGHRGAGTEALLGGIDGPMKAVFRTANPVLIAAASATGFMEAAVRNGVRKKVLCLVNGAFSKRFANADSVLRSAPNVVLTPHLAASAKEAQTRVSQEIGGSVKAFLVKGDLGAAVNRKQLGA